MAVIEGGNVIEGSQLARTYTNPGVPVDGVSGTLAGIAEKGALLTDSTNAKLHINTGTKAAPTWTVVGTQT